VHWAEGGADESSVYATAADRGRIAAHSGPAGAAAWQLQQQLHPQQPQQRRQPNRQYGGRQAVYEGAEEEEGEEERGEGWQTSERAVAVRARSSSTAHRRSSSHGGGAAGASAAAAGARTNRSAARPSHAGEAAASRGGQQWAAEGAEGQREESLSEGQRADAHVPADVLDMFGTPAEAAARRQAAAAQRRWAAGKPASPSARAGPLSLGALAARLSVPSLKAAVGVGLLALAVSGLLVVLWSAHSWMFPAPSEVVTRSLLGLLQEERGLAECGVKGHTGALDAEAVAAHLRVDPRTNVSVAALLQARSDAELAGRRTAAPLALSGTATGAELELEQEQRVEALVSDLLCNITGGQTDNDAARNRWEAWAVAGREVEGVKAARVATTELGQLQRAAVSFGGCTPTVRGAGSTGRWRLRARDALRFTAPALQHAALRVVCDA
jgi:hypothetical protein